MGIGYIALSGFGAKCGLDGWSMDGWTIEHYWTLLNTIEHYWTLFYTIEHYWILVNTIEHHGNRLYCFIRLRCKMLTGWSGVEWSGYPLDCYDYLSTCGANKSKQIFGGMEHLPFCFIHPRWYRFSSCFLMCQEVESKQIKRNSKITQHWKKKKIGSVIVINSAPLLVTISSYGEEWIQRRQNKLHWQPVHGFKIWHI